MWQMQDEQWSQRTYWLIWAQERRHGRGEVLSVQCSGRAPSCRTLLRVAFCRWNVEHTFACGQERAWVSRTMRVGIISGLMRHQTLCLLMLTFVAGHTERLRGEKSGGDDGAGVQCV